jgi:tellurite resistance protein TehA-like permease
MAAFFQIPEMNLVGIGFIIIAFLLFIFASIGYGFRVMHFFPLIKEDFLHPSTSKFFAGISISLAVLSTGTTTVLVAQSIIPPVVGQWLAGILYGLSIILGIFLLIGVCSTMIQSKENKIEQAIGVCLLPPVGLFVSIFAGNFWVQRFFAGTTLSANIGMFHLFLFTLLVLLTSWILTFIVFRLRFHPLPRKEMAPSFFIPLAPAGVSIIALVSLLPLLSPSLPYQAILKTMGFIFIPMMISFGIFWFFIILRVMQSYLRAEGIPYSLGFWALVFPMAAFGISLFISALFLPGFSVLGWFGVVWGVFSTILWGIVFIKTFKAVWTKKAFVRPSCLKH